MIGGIAVLAALIWVYLLAWHGRFWQGGPVLARPILAPPAKSLPAAPEIAVIVPARNEAAVIEETLTSLLAQDYPRFSVTLVDDESSDGTGAIARAIADPRLAVIAGAACPAGWSGKLWALAQGIAASRAPLLYFTDADIRHAPNHLSALAAKLEADRLDMVSEMVRLRCASLAERALVPAFVFFFQMLYPFAWVNDPLRATAAAAGGSVLLRARALAGIGGIARIRGALIDDVTLAKRIKAGGRIWLGHGALAESLRPYPGLGDIWRMITRTAFVQLRYSWLLLALTTLAMALVWLAPPAFALFGHGHARLLGLFGWLAGMIAYAPSLRRFGLSLLWAPWLPLIAGFYMAATLAAAFNHARGRGVAWKARAYGAGTP